MKFLEELMRALSKSPEDNHLLFVGNETDFFNNITAIVKEDIKNISVSIKHNLMSLWSSWHGKEKDYAHLESWCQVNHVTVKPRKKSFLALHYHLRVLIRNYEELSLLLALILNDNLLDRANINVKALLDLTGNNFDKRNGNELTTLKDHNNKPISKPPSVIVWDLDETLWLAVPFYRHCINLTRLHFGLRAWQIPDEFDDFLLHHHEQMFTFMFGAQAKEALKYYYHMITSNVPSPNQAVLLEHTLKTLADIKAKYPNITMVALSNTEDCIVQRLMAHFNLNKFIAQASGSAGCDVKWKDLKPATTRLEALLEKVGSQHIERESIWIIGDSLHSDIGCAEAMKCVGILFGSATALKSDLMPHRIISDIRSVMSLLEMAHQPKLSVLHSNFSLMVTKKPTELPFGDQPKQTTFISP